MRECKRKKREGIKSRKDGGLRREISTEKVTGIQQKKIGINKKNKNYPTKGLTINLHLLSVGSVFIIFEFSNFNGFYPFFVQTWPATLK